MTTPTDSPVTITSCAAVTALGDGLAPLAVAVAGNSSALRPCPRFTGPQYQTNVVGAVPADVWSQLRDESPSLADAAAFLLAHRVIRQLRPQAAGPVGLVLATTKADIMALERVQTGQSCSDAARRHILPGQIAADLAAANEITGPVRCVSVACVSGLLAIQHGVELLQRGAAGSVIVAGVDLLSQFVLAGFSTLKSLDLEGCRPFDKDRTGLSVGEGAGAILLSQTASATRVRAPMVAVTGWGSSNDANHLTGPSRDGSGLALAMERALRRAGVAPGAVDYVHAHGTGTLYNDSMEGLALRSVFGDRVPAYSSSKGLFGHTLGAAGILETILCVGAMQSGIRPGTPRLRVPADDLPSAVQLEPQSGVKLRTIVKINAGFGGMNAALVLQEVPA